MGWDTADGALQKSIFYEFSMSMIRVYFKLIFPIALIFLALTIFARALGTTQPPNPALHGFIEGCEDKPQPCWYGIVPGVTTIEEADTTLKTLGYSFQNERQIMIGDVRHIYTNVRLYCFVEVFENPQRVPHKSEALDIECSSIKLGDLISTVGIPQTFYLRGWSFKDEKFLAEMQFSAADKYRCLDFMPTGIVDHITIGAEPLLLHPQNNNSSDYSDLSWHGFAPYSWYVKLYGLPSCKQLNMLP